MSYVIVKGKSNKALNGFEAFGLPIKSNATKFAIMTDPQSCYSDKLFRFDKDCASIYETIEDAEDYIKYIKKMILNESKRYEDCVKGSTNRLMSFTNQLRIIDIQNSNFKN